MLLSSLLEIKTYFSFEEWTVVDIGPASCRLSAIDNLPKPRNPEMVSECELYLI